MPREHRPQERQTVPQLKPDARERPEARVEAPPIVSLEYDMVVGNVLPEVQPPVVAVTADMTPRTLKVVEQIADREPALQTVAEIRLREALIPPAPVSIEMPPVPPVITLPLVAPVTVKETAPSAIPRAEAGEKPEHTVDLLPEPVPEHVEAVLVESFSLDELVLIAEQSPDVPPPLYRSLFEDEFAIPSSQLATEAVEAPAGTKEQLVDPWIAELAKEPSDIYDDFAKALLQLSDENHTDKPASPDRRDATVFAGETETSEPIPPVVIEVAERLTSLAPEQKETAMPLVQTIVETVHEVRQLQAAEASPTDIAAAEERLTELCVQLFEAIGIEYDEEKIKQFVQSILRPEFRPIPAPAAMLDLEHMGTHEVKRRFPQLKHVWDDLLNQLPLQYVLGYFALFRSAPWLQDDIAQLHWSTHTTHRQVQ